mgnify:CR=1 FL=1
MQSAWIKWKSLLYWPIYLRLLLTEFWMIMTIIINVAKDTWSIYTPMWFPHLPKEIKPNTHIEYSCIIFNNYMSLNIWKYRNNWTHITWSRVLYFPSVVKPYLISQPALVGDYDCTGNAAGDLCQLKCPSQEINSSYENFSFLKF